MLGPQWGSALTVEDPSAQGDECSIIWGRGGEGRVYLTHFSLYLSAAASLNASLPSYHHPHAHPQALYSEAAERLGHLDTFLALLQRRISPLLRRGDLPPRAMIDAVAAAKV